MHSAETIISCLGGNPHTGMSRCPAHDDKNPSLHVSTGASGKVVFKCFAGCSQESVIAALQSRGLWHSERKPTSRSTNLPYEDDEMDKVNEPTAEEERLEKRWQAQIILSAAASPSDWRSAKETTTDHAKQLAPYLKGRGINIPAPPSLMFLSAQRSLALGKVIAGFKPYPAMVAPIVNQGRCQGAQVTYLTRDGRKNLWSNGEGKNIRRTYGVLKGGYVQLGVIDPEQPPDTVIAAEGVEKALAASQLTGGYPALAVLGGNFDGVAPPRCNTLIIAADTDASGTGMQKAEKGAALWAANGRSVRIAAPPQHKDWDDAIRDPNTDPEKLRSLLLHGQQVQPGAHHHVGAVSAAEFMTVAFPPRDYLLEPCLAKGSLTMIHAKRGTAKTWLGLSMANAIATGSDLLGWKAHRPARVLYVDGELQGDLLQRRLQGFGPCLANSFILSRHYLQVHGQQLPDLGTPQGRAYLDRIIEQNQIDVVFLDSISTLVRSGIENEAEHWAPIGDWQLGHRFSGRAIIYLHHEGRSGNPRGTSKREDPFDTMIRLEACPEQSSDNETAFKLSFTKTRDFFGANAAPKMIYLSLTEGLVQWRHEAVKTGKREQIVELLQGGALTQSEISKQVGVDKGYVSRIAKEVGGTSAA